MSARLDATVERINRAGSRSLALEKILRNGGCSELEIRSLLRESDAARYGIGQAFFAQDYDEVDRRLDIVDAVANVIAEHLGVDLADFEAEPAMVLH